MNMSKFEWKFDKNLKGLTIIQNVVDFKFFLLLNLADQNEGLS
jgi:hypothetical protein